MTIHTILKMGDPRLLRIAKPVLEFDTPAMRTLIADNIPAIAFSQVEKGWAHVEDAARIARELVLYMTKHHTTDGRHWLLNVNIPNRPYAQLKPAKVCRLGRRHAAEKVISQPSPHGQTMYWIGAAGPARDGAEGTDFHATAQGHVSLTPLQVDLTDHDGLPFWTQAATELVRGEG